MFAFLVHHSRRSRFSSRTTSRPLTRDKVPPLASLTLHAERASLTAALCLVSLTEGNAVSPSKLLRSASGLGRPVGG